MSMGFMFPQHVQTQFKLVLLVQVQVLLAELAMVEREITGLETKVESLKKNLYKEKKLNKDGQLEQPGKHLEMQLPYKQQNQRDWKRLERIKVTRSHNRRKCLKDGRLSFGSVSVMQTCSSVEPKGGLNSIL